MLQLNLANALLEGGQPGEAATILNRYTFNNKDDVNGWDLLAQAEAKLGNRDQELAARAEGMALVGRLDQAITLLSSASSQVKLGSLQQARYDARIDQLRQLLKMLGMASARDLMRQKEDLYKSLDLANPQLSEDALIQAMVDNPKLIERPIVVSHGEARIGRPPEQVLEIVN